MPKYLGQILAMEKQTRDKTRRRLTDAHHGLDHQAMLMGITKEYEPAIDDGEQLPPEGTLVQVTVKEMIDRTRDALVKLFDITAARDFTNGPGAEGPVADVIVGEQVLIEKAPVPYLLWLEKQLEGLTTFAAKLPVLDAAKEWELDEPRGVYRTPVTWTARQTRVPKSLIAAPATKEHPAKVHIYEEAVTVGKWKTVHYSGAVKPSERAELLQRIERLQEAVHVAREKANRSVAVEPEFGERLVSYIFG